MAPPTDPPNRIARRKPPALQPGDTLAIISPAGATTDPPDAFERGMALVEAAGFRPRLMPHARDKRAYLAGQDADRLADLHAAFADPGIHGILCARGGYGCMRLLPGLDFERVARHPKALIGFSDVTALLLPLYQRSGLCGFYGPMLTSNLVHGEPFSEAAMWPLLQGQITLPFSVPNSDSWHCFRAGSVEAPLVGGNLSLLAALCGTPFQPRTAGHILFIEDWKEKYYSLDRQFEQLKQAGLFEGIRGLVLCDFSDIEGEPDWPLADFLRELTAFTDVPAGYGFSVGHGAHTATLPIGIQARFDAATGSLSLLESPVT